MDKQLTYTGPIRVEFYDGDFLEATCDVPNKYGMLIENIEELITEKMGARTLNFQEPVTYYVLQSKMNFMTDVF